MPRPRRPIVLLLVCVGLVGAAAAGWWFFAPPHAVAPEDAHYVGRATCARCHAGEEKLWRGSHHDRAMDPATADTVLGDFDDARFEHDGVVTTFRRDGDKFVVRTLGPDGELHDYDVRWVFGFTPLEQDLVELENGHVQCLRQAWDADENRWFDLYPDEHIPPHDELFWAGRAQNWNWMCADCHSTGLRRNYDAKTDTYATTFEEIDVSCEACHGPGSAHVAWAESGPIGRHSVAGQGLVVRLSPQDPRPELESCAPCHSRRGILTEERIPGQPFDDGYRLSLLDPGLYEADGQNLEEVYVYGSFLESRMHHEGIRCTNCHEPHTARLRFEGNALCTQCHVATTYDVPSHHHHDVDGEGAKCVVCHMPQRTYMAIDERRDHSFRVPRPDLTVRYGVPNSCGACHAEKGAQWAADAIHEWTGKPPYESPFTKQGEWTAAFSAARAGRGDAGAKLAALAADVTQPAIVRASALSQLAGFGLDGRATARAALDDPDPLVRAAAVSFFEVVPPEQRAAEIAPLTADPSRRVRIQAARLLASVPPGRLPEAIRDPAAKATDDFLGAQQAALERPESWLMLGVFAHDRGDRSAAEFAYRKAIERDPAFVPARMNLAVLLDGLDRTEEAEKQLREVLALSPDYGEGHYALGLVLAARREYRDAERHLERAAELMPGDPRVKRNLEAIRAR